jgi:hypothetical protein
MSSFEGFQIVPPSPSGNGWVERLRIGGEFSKYLKIQFVPHRKRAASPLER